MNVPQPLYLFDGYCVLCSGFVQFCLRHDGDGQLKFAANQSPLGQRIVAMLDLPPGTTDRTVLLIEDDQVFSQSTAALRALRHLKGWPRLLRPFALVPRFLRDPVYDLIAHNRYRWFGRRTSCFVPTPEIRSRFVDL
ncbi:MAG TPA: DCC1-like thiol-disulfide oxidoreductase family protein [Reyranella sp.]|nr:DCC1-like thiol-disulfide oxidoreductase family protein [Reyranella sp.]